MDLLDLLIADHRRFQTTLAQVSRLLFGPELGYFSRGRRPEITATVLNMLNDLFPALRRHEVRESRLLFPPLLRALPRLRPAVDAIETEHDRTRRLLDDFERAVSARRGIPNRVIIDHFLRLSGHMNRHMLREETELFGPARSTLPAEKLAAGMSET